MNCPKCGGSVDVDKGQELKLIGSYNVTCLNCGAELTATVSLSFGGDQ